MVPPAPVRHGPALPAGGKAPRKLHPLPIASNLEAWLGRLGLLPRPGSGSFGQPGRRPGLLALDVSKRAIGVAGADAGWQLATALTTIRRKGWAHDRARLEALIGERAAGALVIGWPLNMDGSEGPRCQAVGAFAARLEAEVGVDLLWRTSRRVRLTEAGEVLARRTRLSPGQRPAVLIGKDTRISGYMLEASLEAGFAAAGVDVMLSGPMPTPAVAYLTRALRLQAGVVISASHNPYPDNGIKFFDGDGNKLPDAVEAEIEAQLAQPMRCAASGASIR